MIIGTEGSHCTGHGGGQTSRVLESKATLGRDYGRFEVGI